MHTAERETRTVELMWTPSGVPVVQSLAVAPSVRLAHVVVVVHGGKLEYRYHYQVLK